jgi:hypothetical protein
MNTDKLKEIINRERWETHVPDLLIVSHHNKSLDRIEAAVLELLTPVLHPVRVNAHRVKVFNGVFEVPDHYECPKCSAWVREDHTTCPHGCCIFDWSEIQSSDRNIAGDGD